MLKLRRGVVWLTMWAVAACAPVLSPAVTATSEVPVAFLDLQRHTEQYQGRTVIVGGTIVAVHNDPDGNFLEVVQRPLGFRQAPQRNDRSEGRFLVQFDQPLDPAIYSRDRGVTLAGEVTGSQSRKIDQMSYDFPVLTAREIYLWPVEAEVGVAPGFFFSFGFVGSF